MDAGAQAASGVGARRRETSEARALRDRRQRFAAPGGTHDRLVGVLSRVLPMGVGVLAAVMIITPLSPRGEISFLLDRDKVETIDQRMTVQSAMYRGRDNLERPFSITAGEAVQRSSVEGLVRLRELMAQLLLTDGPARLSAPGGVYDIDREVVDIDGTIVIRTADGYAMRANGVSFDFGERTMRGTGGVEGAIPAATFSADSMRADLEARTVRLEGNAQMTMVPGKLRMP